MEAKLAIIHSPRNFMRAMLNFGPKQKFMVDKVVWQYFNLMNNLRCK